MKIAESHTQKIHRFSEIVLNRRIYHQKIKIFKNAESTIFRLKM
ncbi:hypothetical protein ACWIUD_07710 [Helicobacter sp. 23-1044]